MTERLRESLSALMDDEADDLELGRVLRAMDDAMDQEGGSVRETWSRYQLVSAVMRGIPSSGLSAAGSSRRYADVDAAGRQAGPEEMVERIAAAASEMDRGVAGQSATGNGSRPWTSFAAAAGVTLALVVGFQWQGVLDESDAVPERVVSTPTDAGPVRTDPRALMTANGEPLNATSDRGRAIVGPLRIPSPLAGTAPSARAPDAQRQVDAYMLFHAEMSALNSSTGMVPFARYAAFEGAPRN